jgi:DNA-binding transcriptional MerR regulator
MRVGDAYMLRIGDFSKLGLVTIKALRHYDTIGLLKPARVDETTGYRYYSASQLTRLNRILVSKDMGLELEQIARLLDQDLTAEQIRGMLRLKRVELQQQVEEGQARLARVEAWLQAFEREAVMPAYDIVLKKVMPLRVAQVRFVAPDWGHVSPTLGRVFFQLQRYIREQEANWHIPGITLFYNAEHIHEAISIAACLTFDGSLTDGSLIDGEEVKVVELPALEAAASVIHHGSFSTLHLAYNAMLKWIESNGYTTAGPNRELNLAYDPDGDESQYVTEIQFPVIPTVY